MKPYVCLVSWLCAIPSALIAVPEGFVIQEFAEPPEVEYPVGISAAANGDVYVSVDKNGSLGHKKDFGSIVRARDTDGDGKADDFVDFVPTLDSPREGHFVGGTFYLIHPPYLSSYRDTNGDGVADEHKQLVKGFGWGIEHPRGADHTTNGVRMGIDGWLYVGVGDFGMPDAVGADGTRYTLHGGGVVRVRPDGSEMEPYALMTRNHFAPAITPYLDLFVRDNTNDGKGWNTRLHHFTQFGDHGYPRLYKNFANEIIKPLADYGGGSGTGATYIHEPGFPDSFGDMLYTCDWTTGHIYYHPLEPYRASFLAKQSVFHKLPRATDIDVDGYSRIYLADWRNGKFKYKGPKKKVGKIHQVTYPKGKAAQYVDVTQVEDAKLPALLESRSAVQRLEAQREMIQRGPKETFAKKTIALAKDDKAPLYARVAAIFTFKQLYGQDATPELAKLVGDASIREFALRAMTDRLSELEGVPLDPYLTALGDPSARVRLQATIGLGRLKAKSAAPALLKAAANWSPDPDKLPKGASPRLTHTAIKALARIGNINACLAVAKNPAQRPIALRALEEIHGPEAVDGLIDLLNQSEDTALIAAGIRTLARLYHVETPWDLKDWWHTRPDDRGPYYKPKTWEKTPKIQRAIKVQFAKLEKAQHDGVVKSLKRNRIDVSKLKLNELKPLTLALAAGKPTDAQYLMLRQAASDSSRPWELRLSAYNRLGEADYQTATPVRLNVLAQWLNEKKRPAIATQAINDFVTATERSDEVELLLRLAKKENDAASHLVWRTLLIIHQSPLTKPETKQMIAKAIDKNPREIGFFRALAELKLPGFETQIAAAIESDNEQLINAAKAARKATKTASSEKQQKVAELKPTEILKYAMKEKGDPEQGKRLFTSTGCIACHSVNPDAEQKGPYLGNAGSKFTRDYLIESITEPNKVIAQGFRTTVFTTKKKKTHTGFVTSEVDSAIELRDIAGKKTILRREMIASEKELATSMMPPGLTNQLTLDEFTSLIDYLVSLKAENE